MTTNFYQEALATPKKDRTPFQEYKTDPTNTFTPWWLSPKIMESMPEVCEDEYRKEQHEIQIKAFQAGFKAGEHK